jgi:hypothetical protein
MTNPTVAGPATTTDAAWRLRARTQFVAVPAPGGGIAKVILRLGERTGRIEPFDPAAERLLRELSAGGTARDVLDRVVAELGPASRDRAAALLDDLLDGGFCEQTVPPTISSRPTWPASPGSSTSSPSSRRTMRPGTRS